MLGRSSVRRNSYDELVRRQSFEEFADEVSRLDGASRAVNCESVSGSTPAVFESADGRSGMRDPKLWRARFCKSVRSSFAFQKIYGQGVSELFGGGQARGCVSP